VFLELRYRKKGLEGLEGVKGIMKKLRSSEAEKMRRGGRS